MLVTITPTRAPHQAFSLVDGSWLNWRPSQGAVCGLLKDGLDGWHNGVAPEYESPSIPGDHGSYAPDTITLASRIVTVRGFYAELRHGSSVSASQFADRLAALVGESILLTVEDAAGPRSAEGFVSAIPVHERRTDGRFLFTLVITCPDPLKYGPRLDFPVTGPSVVVRNEGTGDVFPRFEVTGEVTVLDVQVPGRRVRWQGNARDLVLDFKDGFPLSYGAETGTLVWAQIFRLPPGETTLRVECDGDVKVGVASGWK